MPERDAWHNAAHPSSPYSGRGPAGGRDRENNACAPSPSRNPSDLASRPESHALNARGQAEAYPTETNSKSPRQTVITYREYVTHRTAPRDLAHEIIARSLAREDADGFRTAGLRPAHLPLGLSSPFSGTGTPACAPSSRSISPDLASRTTSQSTHEKIDAIYLSPDAFARRTDEASIADQMGDVFAAAGFPRPIPADNDRIGGWMLMYQMLDADEWLLTDNCIELIRTIPTLVRDMARIEDIEKMDGDDPADAARYGLKSRYATSAAYSIEHLPYEARLAARVLSADPTVRAIQARKAQLEEHRRTKFVPRRRR